MGWLKQSRAVATRFEKLVIHCLGGVKLAMARQHLQISLLNITQPALHEYMPLYYDF